MGWIAAYSRDDAIQCPWCEYDGEGEWDVIPISARVARLLTDCPACGVELEQEVEAA